MSSPLAKVSMAPLLYGDFSGLWELEVKVRQFPKQYEKSVRSSLNQAANGLVIDGAKILAGRYAKTAKEFKKNFSTKRARGKDLVALVRMAGPARVFLTEWGAEEGARPNLVPSRGRKKKGTVGRVKGGGLRFQILKKRPGFIRSGFIPDLQSGKELPFIRTSRKRYPITKLQGTSGLGWLTRDDVIKDLRKKLQIRLEKALKRQLYTQLKRMEGVIK